MLGLYLPDHPKTVALNIGGRQNNYSLLTERKPKAFQKIIFIHPASDSISGPLFSEAFSSVERRGTVSLDQGRGNERSFTVYLVAMRKSL
jgi:hypothetical protein